MISRFLKGNKVTSSFTYKIKPNKLLLILLAIDLFLLLTTALTNFTRIHEYNNVIFSFFAENYLKFGYLKLNFAPVDLHTHAISLPKDVTYYINHPILLPLILSLFYKFLGISNLVGRLVPILFSLVSVLSLYLLVKKYWGEKIALLGSFIFVFSPMNLIFGKVINYEPLTMAFSLGALLFYSNWFEHQKKKRFSHFCFPFDP